MDGAPMTTMLHQLRFKQVLLPPCRQQHALLQHILRRRWRPALRRHPREPQRRRRRRTIPGTTPLRRPLICLRQTATRKQQRPVDGTDEPINPADDNPPRDGGGNFHNIGAHIIFVGPDARGRRCRGHECDEASAPTSHKAPHQDRRPSHKNKELLLLHSKAKRRAPWG